MCVTTCGRIQCAAETSESFLSRRDTSCDRVHEYKSRSETVSVCPDTLFLIQYLGHVLGHICPVTVTTVAVFLDITMQFSHGCIE